MVKSAVRAILLASAIAVSGLAPAVSDAGEIRFYKVNGKGQQREIGLLRNRDEPGCHNMLGSRDVFRVAQIGFTYCTVYAADDCAEDGALIMNWKGRVKKNSVRAQPTDRLMPGDMWYFGDNDVREVHSWFCRE
ncbi:MAG: hypothetical protein DWQ08_06285 [Proteobacteria bacterium]|nr:MAG: hypothetical protein DWQ08_06285 [Pseudomonadota bacterium]